MLNPALPLIHIADINGVHGLKGALFIYSHTRPAYAVAGYRHFRIGKTIDEARQSDEYVAVHCHPHGKRILMRLDGVHSPEDAQGLLGQKLWVEREDVDVDDDEYLWDDLIGLTVYEVDSDTELGCVSDIQDFGAQDTLIITSGDGEWMIPFIDEVIVDVDIQQGIIRIHLLDGMDACFTPNS